MPSPAQRVWPAEYQTTAGSTTVVTPSAAIATRPRARSCVSRATSRPPATITGTSAAYVAAPITAGRCARSPEARASTQVQARNHGTTCEKCGTARLASVRAQVREWAM